MPGDGVMTGAMLGLLLVLAWWCAAELRRGPRQKAQRRVTPEARRHLDAARDLRTRTLEADVLTPLEGVIEAAEARAEALFLASQPKVTDVEGRQLQIRAILEHGQVSDDEQEALISEYQMLDDRLRARESRLRKLAALRAELTCTCLACGNAASDVVVLHGPEDERYLDPRWCWLEVTALGDARPVFLRGQMTYDA